MAHFLVDQLRFTRGEFTRSFAGVSEEDAIRRLLPMNSISWLVAHLACQEHYYWVACAQGKMILPEIIFRCGYGTPASTPPLSLAVEAWKAVIAEADFYLDTLTPVKMETFLAEDGRPFEENVGTTLVRNMFHYWSHLGEIISIRQIMGHTHVPEYVGDLRKAMYRPEG
jgi:hypothetical protein